MIVRMGLLTRKPGITTEQFRRHWREVHGPLAAHMPGLRRYHQNHLIDASPLGSGTSPVGWHLDGISELWFDDMASMQAAVASDAYRAVAADEPNCMVGTKVIVAEQSPVMPLPPDNAIGPLVKCMSILARAPDVEPGAFREAWCGGHAARVARLPGLAGYTQNIVVERAVGGRTAAFETVPVDGVAELWFRDVDALHAAFASDAAREVASHARAFIGTTTTWQVEVHAVV
jgi:uncharacterized protein (TIGR02118 family)